MTISRTTRTAPSSTHSSSKIAPPLSPSRTKRRPRRLSRRCRSERSTRAKKPQRPHSHQREGKVLRQLQMVKAPAGPSSGACCIAQALAPVQQQHQLPRRHYQLHHLPRNLRVPRRLRQIYPLISMTRRKKGFWMSFYRWALRKIRLQRIPTSSKAGLPESSKPLLLRLQPLPEGPPLHLLPLHPKRTLSALREPVPVQVAGVGLRPHHRRAKLVPKQQRSRLHLHRVNPRRRLDDSTHPLHSQMPANSRSQLAQHTPDGRERHPAQLRVPPHRLGHRRLRWTITSLVRTDSECHRHSQVTAKSRRRLRLLAAALHHLALHPHLLEQ